MYNTIASIYYFNYENEIGYYQSFRNFCLRRMVYVDLALSTPKKRVYSSPNKFQISEKDSSFIREYMTKRIDSLAEIEKPVEYNPAKYFKFCYTDGTEKYFGFDKEFCRVLDNASIYKLSDQTDEIISTPYLVFNSDRSAKIAMMIERISMHLKTKQLLKILPFLHDDCVLNENYKNNSNTIVSKKCIKDKIKMEAGFLNKKLKNVRIDALFEGFLQYDHQSELGIMLDISDKKQGNSYLSLKFSFDTNYFITNLTISDFLHGNSSKLIFPGSDFEKIKTAKYNDFSTVVF